MTFYQILVECGNKLLVESRRESIGYNHDDMLAFLRSAIEEYDYEEGDFIVTTSQSGDNQMLVKRLFEVTCSEIHEYDLEWVTTYSKDED